MKNKISLLWPDDTRISDTSVAPLHPTAIENLKLEQLCTGLCEREDDRKAVLDILTHFTHSERIIQYRQEIFNDFLALDTLAVSFENILNSLRNLRDMAFRHSMEENSLWELFSRYKELEAYVDCVTIVTTAMHHIPLRSQGLQRFRDQMEQLMQDAEYSALTGIVKSLTLEINEIHSITLGINLDSTLSPESVTLHSINKTRFTEHITLPRMLLHATRVLPDDMIAPANLKRVANDRRDPIMYSLYKDIERCMKPVIKQLSTSLNRFAKIYTGHLSEMIPEIVFYLSFIRLHRKLTDHGMPCCVPGITKTGDRSCRISGAYHLSLALHMLASGENPAQEIVLNHVSFGEQGRILIITGANMGGKTVYTEMTGLIHVLFQAGVFIPGKQAAISPVDNIFAHFPADESKTVELGRLGEESKRLGEIFNQATALSLLLLNESLTSTSYTEGLYLAQEIVRAMRYLGARAVFNTHLHALAERVDEMNDTTTGNSAIQSLVTGIQDGKRMYVIEPGVPLGKSYAMEIAMKYGVSFGQIAAAIDQKDRHER